MLIGMPSSGKSTIGARLAEKIGFGFIDSDSVIRGIEGKSLSEIIAERGTDGFLAVEERINAGLDVSRCVIATGGSVVYSDYAMSRLKRKGKCVFLDVGVGEIKRRIPDLVMRGVVMRGTLNCVEDLYAERVPLYEKYADVTVDCNGKTADAVVSEIVSATANRFRKKNCGCMR